MVRGNSHHLFLFSPGFLGSLQLGGGGGCGHKVAPHHNFFIIVLIMMKLGKLVQCYKLYLLMGVSELTGYDVIMIS